MGDGFGWETVLSDSYVAAVVPLQTFPLYVSCLLEFKRTDAPADKYGSVLDGKLHPDTPVQTFCCVI